MKLPKLDDLIGEQLAIYETPADANLFVAGPPGSGKTTLAVLRTKFLEDQAITNCLVTKNRMLKALATRLGAKAATMSTHLTKDHASRIGVNAPQHQPFDYDWTTIRASYAKRSLGPSLNHLVIDEGQNLPSGFFDWAVRYGGATLTVFADENQTTDSQRSTLSAIVRAGLPQPVRLETNHRNTEEIARMAEFFHRSSLLPACLARKGRNGELPKLLLLPTWQAIAERVAARFLTRSVSIGVIVFKQDEASALAALIRGKLPPNSRIDCYTSAARPGVEDTIDITAPGVTVLSSESAIGLEFDTVFLQDLSRSLPCDNEDKRRRLYMLCARAQNHLFLVNGPSALSAAQLDSLPDGKILER